MKLLRISALALLAVIAGFAAWSWFGWHKVIRGYEVDPRTHSSYLQKELSEDLGYSGFETSWLQKAWVNGFQDHTYLFLVAPDSSDLRHAIGRVAGTEPISSSNFRDGGYLGPSTAPAWWNTSAIDSTESHYFRKESRLWRFTWIGDHLYIVLSVS